MDFNELVNEYVNELKFKKINSLIEANDLLQEFYIWINTQNTDISWILRGKSLSMADERKKWCYEQALCINENNNVANYLLAHILRSEKQWDLAISHYSRCLMSFKSQIINDKVNYYMAICHHHLESWYLCAYYSLAAGEIAKEFFVNAISFLNNADKIRLYNESESEHKNAFFAKIKIKVPVSKMAKAVMLKEKLLEENQQLRFRPPELGGPEYEQAYLDYESIKNDLGGT